MQDPTKPSAVSPATTIARRGSPVMQPATVENEENFAQWYEGVNELFAYVVQLTATYEIDFTDATAKKYVDAILEAIRTNRYDELAKHPKMNLGILDEVFPGIDDFIQSRRFIVERHGISDTQIKSLIAQINQSGIPVVQPITQNNNSFAKWREGVEELSTLIRRLTKLYEMPDSSSVANAYLGSILDAIRTNRYDMLAKDSQTNLGIPSIFFDGFEGINAYLEVNRYIILRVNVSDAQINKVKAEMGKKSLLSDFGMEASFGSFGLDWR